MFSKMSPMCRLPGSSFGEQQVRGGEYIRPVEPKSAGIWMWMVLIGSIVLIHYLVPVASGSGKSDDCQMIVMMSSKMSS